MGNSHHWPFILSQKKRSDRGRRSSTLDVEHARACQEAVCTGPFARTGCSAGANTVVLALDWPCTATECRNQPIGTARRHRHR
jgi:hypothetical protein